MSATAFLVPSYADTRPEVFVPRALLPPSALAAEADTIGWDVVHALRLPVVNATLEASGRTPATFGHEIQPGWTVSGSFGPWRLVRGGSNSIVFVKAPMTAARMTFPNVPDLVLGASAVTVAIKLQYLPQPPEGTAGALDPDDGDPQFLAARDQSPNPDDPPAVIQAVDYGGVAPSPVQDALFKAAMGKWFNADLNLFTYIFCALSINGRAAQGDFQWLKPTYTGYAYANGASDEQSCFGVLTMTSGNDPGGRINQLAPAAVPPGCSASVLISRPSFLRRLMIPGLTRALAGTVESDFEVDSAGNSITSLRSIALAQIDVDGTKYDPVITELTLQIVGDEIQLHTRTRIEVSPGIASIVMATDFFRITLVNKPEGGQTLDFTTSRPQTRVDMTEKALWVDITEVLVAIIGAIAAIIAGIVIPGAGAALVAVLLIGLVAGLAAATPTLIAKVAGGKAADALPSIAELLTATTADIHWPQSAGLELLSVELNGSLQLGGRLRPAVAR